MAKMGRPLIEIDFKLVDSLCAIWCTGEEIAGTLDVDYDTLQRAVKRKFGVTFAEYYKRKSAKGNMSLRRAQYKAAVTDEKVPMQIWLGKQNLGQKDKIENDQVSSDGSMTPNKIVRVYVNEGDLET